MTETDLETILEIEQNSFPEPYTRQLLLDELKINCAELVVAEKESKVIGYIDFWVVHDEIELISIAVLPLARQNGVGEMLMNFMIQYARKNAKRIIYLDVRESNSKAKNLYGKLGFHQAGIRKRYYKNNKENALIMVKEL